MHPVDQWENDADVARKAFKEQALRDTSLVYQVFSTEAGQQLIGRWKEILMMSPTAQAGLDQISIGMNEGYKSFVRSILLAIKTHEDEL